MVSIGVVVVTSTPLSCNLPEAGSVAIFTWVKALLSTSANVPKDESGITVVPVVVTNCSALVEVGGVLNTFTFSTGVPPPAQGPKTNPK